jgi:hypothetical protein
MLFFPVFAKLQPRPVPPVRRGDHLMRRGTPDSDRGGKVASSRLVRSSIPFIQPLFFHTLMDSSAQWTLATPFLSSASRLFLLQWGYTPLPSGMSPNKEPLGNWGFDPLNSPSFHFSPFTGHGLRDATRKPLLDPRAQKEFTNCAVLRNKPFACHTLAPREFEGAPFMGKGGMTCANHKPRPAMIKKEGRCVDLQTEPQ